MSYRIEYRKPVKRRPMRLPVLTAMCFLLFLFLVKTCWPEGSAVISDAFRWVSDSGPVMALEEFARDLAGEEQVTEAFSDFVHSFLS